MNCAQCLVGASSIPRKEVSSRADPYSRRSGGHVLYYLFHENRVGCRNKHRSYDSPGSFPKVRYEGCHEVLHLGGGQLHIEIGERINHHEPDHSIRSTPRRLDNNRCSHRMADQDDLLQPEFVDHSRDVFAKRSHSPLFAIQTRVSMSSEIEGHYSVGRGEVVKLLFPIAAVAEPAVHKHQGHRTLTSGLIAD